MELVCKKKIDQLGRITLPKGIRERLGLDEVAVFVDGDSVIIKRIEEESQEVKDAKELLRSLGYEIGDQKQAI